MVTELPEGDSGRSGYIQGIDTMCHWNSDNIVGCVDMLLWESVALGPHNDGKTRLGGKDGRVKGYGIVGERHSDSLKTEGGKVRGTARQPCPWNKEHRAHGHTYGTSVVWVARVGGYQYGIHAKCCGRAEDGSYVGGVHYSIDDAHSPCPLAHLFYGGQLRTAHGTQHATRKDIASKFRQQLAATSIDGYIPATGYDIIGIAGDMPALAEQRDRLVAGTEGNADDLRALDHDECLVGMQPIAQLGICQGTIRTDSRVIE